jgi:hypothetical protein
LITDAELDRLRAANPRARNLLLGVCDSARQLPNYLGEGRYGLPELSAAERIARRTGLRVHGYLSPFLPLDGGAHSVLLAPNWPVDGALLRMARELGYHPLVEFVPIEPRTLPNGTVEWIVEARLRNPNTALPPGTRSVVDPSHGEYGTAGTRSAHGGSSRGFSLASAPAGLALLVEGPVGFLGYEGGVALGRYLGLDDFSQHGLGFLGSTAALTPLVGLEFSAGGTMIGLLPAGAVALTSHAFETAVLDPLRGPWGLTATARADVAQQPTGRLGTAACAGPGCLPIQVGPRPQSAPIMVGNHCLLPTP